MEWELERAILGLGFGGHHIDHVVAAVERFVPGSRIEIVAIVSLYRASNMIEEIPKAPHSLKPFSPIFGIFLDRSLCEVFSSQSNGAGGSAVS